MARNFRHACCIVSSKISLCCHHNKTIEEEVRLEQPIFDLQEVIMLITYFHILVLTKKLATVTSTEDALSRH